MFKIFLIRLDNRSSLNEFKPCVIILLIIILNILGKNIFECKTEIYSLSKIGTNVI